MRRDGSREKQQKFKHLSKGKNIEFSLSQSTKLGSVQPLGFKCKTPNSFFLSFSGLSSYKCLLYLKIQQKVYSTSLLFQNTYHGVSDSQNLFKTLYLESFVILFFSKYFSYLVVKAVNFCLYTEFHTVMSCQSVHESAALLHAIKTQCIKNEVSYNFEVNIGNSSTNILGSANYELSTFFVFCVSGLTHQLQSVKGFRRRLTCVSIGW